MKPIAALAVALLAGVATFVFQPTDPQARAASFKIPDGPDWRQQLLANDPGKEGIDKRVARLTQHLSLTSDQAAKARVIVQRGHDRIEALLLTGPPSLTREQFVAQSHHIRDDTKRQIEALLTPEQRALVEEMQPAVPLPGERRYLFPA